MPQLLDQVVDELRHGRSPTDEITKSATRHGNVLLREGFSVGQVVHGYGDVCQSVTELAVEQGAPISADDFRTLNRCLDDAIAGAVTEHAREQAVTATTPGGGPGELRNLANTALIAFDALHRGNVGVGGSTRGGAPRQSQGHTRAGRSTDRRGRSAQTSITRVTRCAPRLPQQLEAELQLPGIVGARDGAERAGAADAAGRAEVRAVEQVERLEPQLKCAGPPSGTRLDAARSNCVNFGPRTVLRFGVAERLARIGRHAHAVPVEPVRDRLRAALRVRIARHVRPVVVRAAEVLRDPRDHERRARRVGERHRLTGEQTVDARPAAIRR